ncbi:MAG: TldD/PmbA family protein [Acidobacteriota bacterium]
MADTIAEKTRLVEWVASLAKKDGADEVSVDIDNRREIEVEYRDGQLDKLKDSKQNSLTLGIYAGSRYSSSSTNDLRRETLPDFIKNAIAETQYLGEDEFRSLPDPEYYPKETPGDLNINDPQYESITSEQRVDLSRKIEEAALFQSDQIISVTSSYGDTYYETVKLNSNGFSGSSKGTYYQMGASATVRDPAGGRPQDYCRVTVRHFDSLLNPEAVGKEAVERALAKVGQAKIDSGRYPVLVENRVAGMPVRRLFNPMGARAIQQKQSCLQGKLNEKIASANLTLTDDPLMPGGMDSRYYDDEGLALHKRTLIEKGVLKTYLIDNYYGRKLEMKPNTGGTCNLTFAQGRRSLDDMISRMKMGVLINGFIGGNMNPVTGDFSFGITGILIRDGKRAKPINEMNVSGNILDFWQLLDETGNDPYPYSSIMSPTLRFRDIQLSGV